MQDYHRLLVWKKAHLPALAVHRLSERIPRRSNADLINQIRRAATSVPANIVEGSSRATDRDFGRFLQIALASASELEYHLELATDGGLIERTVFMERQAEIVEVKKMLFGLIKRTKRPSS